MRQAKLLTGTQVRVIPNSRMIDYGNAGPGTLGTLVRGVVESSKRGAELRKQGYTFEQARAMILADGTDLAYAGRRKVYNPDTDTYSMVDHYYVEFGKGYITTLAIDEFETL